jgi:hypothetical protein
VEGLCDVCRCGIDDDDAARGYPTAEEAMLSGYTPGAAARVVEVTMLNENHSRVRVDTDPSHPYSSIIHRHANGRWTESYGTSGTALI